MCKPIAGEGLVARHRRDEPLAQERAPRIVIVFEGTAFTEPSSV
jgi:hypothetical protein